MSETKNIQELIEGYRAFHEKYFELDDELYRNLEQGQAPKTLVVACSDSRVDPSIITNARPGDIFTVRNVANLVPPYAQNDNGVHGVSAALEFAVCALKVKHIIVLGHSNCGGIKNLLSQEHEQPKDFVSNWMKLAKSAKKAAKEEFAKNEDGEPLQHVCEKEGIKLSLENLLTFPWIKSRVEAGELDIHGWYFSIKDGKLQRYDEGNGSFEVV